MSSWKNGVNRLTPEEVYALRQGKNPLADCGLPPPQGVRFGCDSCRQGLRPRNRSFDAWKRETPATLFALLEDMMILEGRCQDHVKFVAPERRISYEVGAEFLFHKFCLADVLRS